VSAFPGCGGRISQVAGSRAVLSERFEIEAPLGQGAMGAVYRAFDRERHQRVALKRLLVPDATSIYRFKREFRALANVSHPNLVALYDLVASDDEWCFTMELVHGTDFLSYVRGEGVARSPSQVSRTRELEPDARVGTTVAAGASEPTKELESAPAAPVKADAETVASPTSSTLATKMASEPAKREARGKLDVERLRSVLSQLVQAIHALHQTGHLHRDIKPSNVMVTDEGRVVVLDFGVITELSGSRRAGDDRIAGTPSYMAPELLDEVTASEASDWYALGVVLYRALTGLVPFVGGSETILAAKRLRDIPLQDLLDCEAPDDLIMLCRDLIQRDPEKRPTGDEILHRLGLSKLEVPAPEPADVHLVGREAELDALRTAWMDSRTGTGVGVFLDGVSGVGKSALVERFLHDLEGSSNAVVLSGRCYEQESVPYKAIDSLVDSAARYLLGLATQEVERLLPDDVIALEQAFPVLGRVEAVAAAIEGRSIGQSKAELQRRAFAALGELIEHLARAVPLVLYIDDLQWGDVESAGLLARLLGPDGPPMLFIASYRSEHVEASPLLPALFTAIEAEPDAQIRKIPVGPLPVTVLESLACELLDVLEPGGAEHGARARHIASEAKGSAYFVQELVRYEVSAPARGWDAKAASLAAVIQARSEQLSAEAQRLLRIVSVAGWRISVGVAQRAAELGPEERRAFVELRAGHFVKSTGTRDTDTIEPYHDRVREMIVGALASEDSQAAHLHIAEALEASLDRLGNEQIYALANHWYLAHPQERQDHVYEINLRAGRTAAASFAYFQANAYLTQAMEAARAAGITPDADTLLLLADVRTRAGQTRDALEGYELVLASSHDPLQRAETHWGISRIRLGWLETGAAIEHALAALGELGLRPPRSELLCWLKAVGAILFRAIGLRHLRARGTAIGDEFERYRLGAAIFIQLGVCYYYHLAPEKLLRVTLLASWVPAKLGMAREVLEWHVLAGGAAAALRKRGLSERLFARCRAISTTIRDPVAVARTRLYQGVFFIMLGDTDAERQLAATLSEVGELLEPHDYFSGAASRAWPRMMRGHCEEGWAIIEHTLRLEAAGGQLNAASGHSYRFYAGPLLARSGRIEEGRKHLDYALDDGGGWRNAQLIGQTILFQLEAEELGAAFDENVRRYLGLRLNPARIPMTFRHGFVAIAYGLLRQIEDAPGDARSALVEKLGEILKKVRKSAKGIPILLAHRSLLDACYANLVGKPERARVLLVEAEERAERTENDWVLYEVAMERARIAGNAGDLVSASKSLAKAKQIADRHGWPQCSRRCARLLAQAAPGAR